MGGIDIDPLTEMGETVAADFKLGELKGLLNHSVPLSRPAVAVAIGVPFALVLIGAVLFLVNNDLATPILVFTALITAVLTIASKLWTGTSAERAKPFFDLLTISSALAFAITTASGIVIKVQ